jgi:transcription termination/antitermination protein NusA
MAIVELKGLRDLIDNISRERHLPRHSVQEAL